MSAQRDIKSFVRNILGCTCPDEVFEQIEDRETASPASPHTRVITVGSRLLIYIWEVKETGSLEKNLANLLAAGRRERDERGLNRFRAVLAVDDSLENIAAAAEYGFAGFPGRDDRIHLHIIAGDALAFL
jgi:hypothetical protein